VRRDGRKYKCLGREKVVYAKKEEGEEIKVRRDERKYKCLGREKVVHVKKEERENKGEA